MPKSNDLLIVLLMLTLLLCGCSVEKKDAAGSRDGSAPAAKQAAQSQTDVKQDDKAEKNASNANSTSYKITKGIYTVNDTVFNVTITYPQITNLGDIDRQLAINEILKNKALRYGKYEIESEMFTEKHTGFPKVFWANVDYEIKWQSERVLSVLYKGSKHYPRRPHPNHYLDGINIDMKNASIIALSDLADFDGSFSFAEKFKEGKIKFVRPVLEGKVFFSNNAALDRKGHVFNDAYLLERFSRRNSDFYLTKDSLGLTVPVVFALGDMVEFEIRYEDIGKSIKAENAVWKDFAK